MAKAIFLTEEWLKLNTVLPYNLDVKLYYPFINISQDTYIRDILGDNLYEALCSSIIASTLTSEQTALLLVIRPALAHYIIYNAMPFLADKIKNIGVVSTADDKQTRSDDKRFDRLRAEVLNIAEYYTVRLQKYLCNNKASFPQYNLQNDDVNPNMNAGYTCDLHIDMDYIDDQWIKRYYRQ